MSKLREDVSKLKGMPVYKVKNVDGLTFWTLMKPKAVGMGGEEKILKTTKMSGDIFNSMSPTDREFILKEFKKIKGK
jgi:hypothetical protein